MSSHIFSSNKFLYKNLVPNLSSKHFPTFEIFKFKYFSKSIHTDDVVDRFRHVKASYKEESEQNVINFYFNSNTPNSKTINSTPPENLLKTYSLENVESALMQFVPEYISSAKDDGNNTFLTPGQAFFLENKEKLMETVRKKYYERKNMSPEQLNDKEILSSLMEDDFAEEAYGSYGYDPLPARDKERIWDYNSSTSPIERQPIELTKGVMPSIQQIVHIMEQERLVEVSVMDMNKCNRRDQGLFVIVATGITPEHCRRVGRMLYNIITDLEIPFVSKVSYCCTSRSEEWIIAHLGPLSVHLMTKDIRNKYRYSQLHPHSISLEDFLSEHFSTRADLPQDQLVD